MKLAVNQDVNNVKSLPNKNSTITPNLGQDKDENFYAELFASMKHKAMHWKDQLLEFVGKYWEKSKDFVKELIFEAKPDRKKLKSLRKKYYERFESMQNNEQKNNSVSDYVSYSKDVTDETKDYVNNIIKDEIKKLGKPPTKFSIFSMGSMARKECGPITDLEIGILVDKKNLETQQYFSKLSQALSDRLFLLGEHPDLGGKGLRLDEADNSPGHNKFFARFASDEEIKKMREQAIIDKDFTKFPHEGSKVFLATPEEFASYSKKEYVPLSYEEQKIKAKKAYYEEMQRIYHDPKYASIISDPTKLDELKKEIYKEARNLYKPLNLRERRIADSAGKCLGRNIDYLIGDKAVYDHFSNAREKILQVKNTEGISARQNLALDTMKKDIADKFIIGDNIIQTGKLGKSFDIKRQFYRFIEQSVTNLGFYNHLDEQNIDEVTKKLVETGKIEPKFGEELRDLINFAMYLRLKKQVLLNRQSFSTYIDKEKYEEDLQELKNLIKDKESAYKYLVSSNSSKDVLDKAKNELIKLYNKHEHLVEEKPGTILSDKDIELLKSKYLPISNKLLGQMQKWTNSNGTYVLGTDIPKLVVDNTNKEKNNNVNVVKPQQDNNLIDEIIQSHTPQIIFSNNNQKDKNDNLFSKEIKLYDEFSDTKNVKKIREIRDKLVEKRKNCTKNSEQYNKIVNLIRRYNDLVRNIKNNTQKNNTKIVAKLN